MIRGIKNKDIRDFVKYATKLSDVLQHIREYKPEANAFLAMDDLHLMSGDFRKEQYEDADKYSVAVVHMNGFDGGDF